MKRLEDIVWRARNLGPLNIAVVAADDEVVLRAVAEAQRLEIARPVLVGDERRIYTMCKELGLKLQPLQIVHEPSAEASAMKAARLVGSGDARILMKGLVSTAGFMRGLLARESHLSTGMLLSHVAVLEPPSLKRLLLCTDGAVNIRPSLEDKIQLVKNLLVVANALEMPQPRVAVLAAIESINERIVATGDAAALTALGDKGVFGQAIVDGPLPLDSAVSERAANQKGILGDVAGRADGLVCPDLESAIAVVKAAVYLGGVKNAGVVVGARAPVVLTSRSDTAETKLVSIALARLLAEHVTTEPPADSRTRRI